MTVGVGVVTGRRVDHIQSETQSLVQDLRQQSRLQSVGKL